MALEIVWTIRAQTGFARIIEYLETHFSEKEVRQFVRQSNDFFELLSQYPEMLEETNSQKHVHRGPINKYTVITYRLKTQENRIELINIRSSRQKSTKLK